MSRMKSNSIMKLVAISGGLIVLILIVLFGSSLIVDKSVNDTAEKNKGSDQDTPPETLRALSSQLQVAIEENKLLNSSVTDKLDTFREEGVKEKKAITEHFSNKFEQLKQESQFRIQQLEDALKQNKQKQITEEKQQQYQINNARKNSGNSQQKYVWLGESSTEISGADVTTQQSLVEQITSQVDGLNIRSISSLGGSSGATANQQDSANVLPVYTIPVNSTLLDSTAMTALIGRVPITGAVADPFRFKIITGATVLTANGIELPDVEAAIWTGTALGDGNLRCVSGSVSSVTFVFKDGTILTQGGSGTGNQNQGLGFISNEYGYQCLPGKYVSNAGKVFKQLSLAGGLEATADAFSNSVSNLSVADAQALLNTNTLSSAVGNGFNAGFQAWADYVRERSREVFDAVVVEPGQNVAIHITEPILIDYNLNGRKVNHVSEVTESVNLGVD